MTVRLKHQSGVEVTPENNKVLDNEYTDLEIVTAWLEARKGSILLAQAAMTQLMDTVYSLMRPTDITIHVDMSAQLIAPPEVRIRHWDHGLIYKATRKGPVDINSKFSVYITKNRITINEVCQDHHTFEVLFEE